VNLSVNQMPDPTGPDFSNVLHAFGMMGSMLCLPQHFRIYRVHKSVPHLCCHVLKQKKDSGSYYDAD
jgi:hypothetical protein